MVVGFQADIAAGRQQIFEVELTDEGILLIVDRTVFVPEVSVEYEEMNGKNSRNGLGLFSNWLDSSISTSVSSIPSWLVRIFVPSCTLSVKLFMILDIWEERADEATALKSFDLYCALYSGV